MKFEVMGITKTSNVSEKVLFDAISKYIDKSKFPKNLMLRKLMLVEDQLNKSNDNINNNNSQFTHKQFSHQFV